MYRWRNTWIKEKRIFVQEKQRWRAHRAEKPETKILKRDGTMIFEIPSEKFKESNTFERRDCFRQLEDYLKKGSTKVCILYGLRRTGKTTMMFQAINDIGPENAGYILCEDGDGYGKLCQKLNEYIDAGKKAVFIDEVTKLSDFITSSASLADYYSGTGTKIVITGTDSLGLDLASRGELFNRAENIHTTYVSYGEYMRLIKNADMDDYIQYAGVLSHEENEQERTFYDRKTASRYIDSAISNNITNTFFRDRLPAGFIHRYDRLIGLHNRNELVPAITAIVEVYSGLITDDVINAYFKQEPYFNADISSALQLLAKHGVFIDKDNFSEDFEGQIAYVLNARRNIHDEIEPEAVSQIIDYLYDLELIVPVPIVRHNGSENAKKRGKEYEYRTSEYIYQAGMKYCQAKALINSIKESNDISLSPREKEQLCQKLDEDIKGKILEVTVFNDFLHFLDKNRYDVFKAEFTGEKDGEIDMVVYDRQKKNYHCFEIKHATRVDIRQQEHLVYKPFQKILDLNYGTRKTSSVLYRGETTMYDDIAYINAGDILSELYLSKEKDLDLVIKNCLSGGKQPGTPGGDKTPHTEEARTEIIPDEAKTTADKYNKAAPGTSEAAENRRKRRRGSGGQPR